MKFIYLQKISKKSYNTTWAACFISIEKTSTSFQHNTGYIERFIIMNTVTHPIPPVLTPAPDPDPLAPSVCQIQGRSFFYHHPQNRFWKTLAGVLKSPVPSPLMREKEFLLSHHIALWDVIASCSIEGSSGTAPSAMSCPMTSPDPVCLQYSGNLLQWEDLLELL